MSKHPCICHEQYGALFEKNIIARKILYFYYDDDNSFRIVI